MEDQVEDQPTQEQDADYPRLVYRSAAESMAVKNQEQREEALASGWFDSVPEALAGKHAAKPEPVAPAKAPAAPAKSAKK